MGVYDHLMRPSMGHKMQVDLRNSMQRYHDDKHMLQRSLSELRLHSHQLTTSPPTPPPPASKTRHPQPSPIRQWGDPDSPFSKAPEVAAHKARLAQLQQQNSHHPHDNHSNEVRTTTTASSSILPPINSRQGDRAHDTAAGGVDTTSQPRSSAKKSTSATTKSTTTTTTTTTNKKGGKGRWGGGTQKKKPPPPPATRKAKDKHPDLIKLPTIPSATQRRSMWDSGRHHLQVQVPSTHLEKNWVDEECRTFSHRSVTIPPISDGKRSEVQRPPHATHLRPEATKVQFRRHPAAQPHPVSRDGKTVVREKTMKDNTAADSQHQPPAPRQTTTLDQILPHNALSEDPPPASEQAKEGTRQPTMGDQFPDGKPTVDHFPKNTPRLSELDDGSTDNEDEDEEEEWAGTGPQGGKGQGQYTSLPALPTVPPSRKTSTNQYDSTQSVPQLRLPRGMTPSAKSTLTAQSGATYMSMVSHETLEWKGLYLSSEDPYFKSRMLSEILHATRQRMRDNHEDLRLTGGVQGGEGEGGVADVMLLHRESTDFGSGANTARSSLVNKEMKLPHHQHKRRVAHSQTQEARLHRYLTKLSHQRRAGEGAGGGRQRRHRHHPPQQQPPPLPLAAMTIREITQSSLGQQSALHTAS